MSRPPLRLIAAAGSLLALAACTPTPAAPSVPAGSSVPTITAAPTFVCTPEAGGAAQPCSEAEHAESVKRDALYAEAEAVMKKFAGADNDMARSGGNVPNDIDSLVTRRFKPKVLAAAASARQSGSRVTSGEFNLSFMGRAPGVSANGSEVALHVCIDTRSATWTGPSGKQMGRGIHTSTTFFAREDGVLKIDSQSQWADPTC